MSFILDEYKKIVGKEAIDQLLQLSQPLKGMKIVHVNSTRLGGGVAEILMKMVPLTQALGIDTRWEVLEGSFDFFQCTKSFHNGLQGNKIFPSASQLQVFETLNGVNAERLKPILQEADIVIVHDPQPSLISNHFPNRKGKWIWRCHIDASKPFRPIWNYLKNFIVKFDATISLAAFSHPLPHPMFVIHPSIDPLSEKNIDLSPSEVKKVLDLFGIDGERPLLLQVSRYDRFKDPLGVIEAYRLVKKFNPTTQLVLAGSGAADDPEGEVILKDVKVAAEDDPNIHVLLLPPDSHRTINALQRGADIVLQKSLKEGFGLTVTEALWKGKPVIGGNVAGNPHSGD